MVWFPGDDLLAATRPRGLPIGNLTSQFWANCYLNPLRPLRQARAALPGPLPALRRRFSALCRRQAPRCGPGARRCRAAGPAAADHPPRRASAAGHGGHPFPGLCRLSHAPAAQAAQGGGLPPRRFRRPGGLCRWPSDAASGDGLGPGVDQPRPVSATRWGLRRAIRGPRCATVHKEDGCTARRWLSLPRPLI